MESMKALLSKLVGKAATLGTFPAAESTIQRGRRSTSDPAMRSDWHLSNSKVKKTNHVTTERNVSLLTKEGGLNS